MATLQVRIDEKTKKNAKRVFDKIGMDMSGAIKVYLNQVVITQGIPFPLLTENGLTIKEEQEILKASNEAQKGDNTVGPFETPEEIQNYLDSLK